MPSILAERLARAGRRDPAGFLPVDLGGIRGRLRPALVKPLVALGELEHTGDALRLARVPVGEPALSRRLAGLAQTLRGAGLLTGWRNETYAIVGDGGEVIAHMERSAFRALGLRAEAAHLVGWVSGPSPAVWVGRRSSTKPIDPGRLDSTAGGGIASDRSPFDTLVKECDEEAGIPAALTRRAAPAGRLRVTEPVPEGLHDERLHVWTLALPAGFVPENRDGEVAGFVAMPVAECLDRIAGDEFTTDAGAVLAMAFERRGLLADPEAAAALAALREA